MRKTIELKDNWLFCETSLGTEQMPDEEDKRWKHVSVPHDWAINGDFSPENDPQPLENSVLDYHEGMIQIGRTGGLPFIGTGWYKRELSIPAEYEYIAVEFDGVMNHGEVYCDGIKIYERPFGYSSFSVDLSDYVKKGSTSTLVIKVNSLPATSRWYPGAGIIRPVRLVMAPKEHIGYCGVWAGISFDDNQKTAEICFKTDSTGGSILSTVFNPEGEKMFSVSGEDSTVQIQNPDLWSVDTPRLYTVMSEVISDGQVQDRVFTKFGIRDVFFDVEKGFFLNGKNIKIQGVCMHHDLGMLGAAYHKDVVKKRLLALKEMGCNAIRTTHNPPCPQTLDICDEIGMLVLDEAFDEWHTCKTQNGYATLFDEWAEIDLRDMIRRDRNHPSVILYSIGNEIPDQVSAKGRDTCKWLAKICHEEDPYRQVTCGFNKPVAAVENGLTEEVDIVGLNYTARLYEHYHKEHPSWCMLATETMSAVATRDEYYLPAVEEIPPVKHSNLQVNGFDLSAVACAYTQDVEFKAQREAPYVAGQFVWSGYDYLGEGTPYREEWPSRSSYFGIFDLAGMKKDRYYAFASEWTNKTVLHLFPHWNWKEGELVDVFCYSNLGVVKFWLNGKELAVIKRDGCRISLGKIPFEPGTITAIGYKRENNNLVPCAIDERKTAGSPFAIRLSACDLSRTVDRGNIAFVDAVIVDENGTICPNASNRVSIQIKGAGEYLASDAGDATCLRNFNKPYCNAFHGKLRIAIQAATLQGDIIIAVTSEHLKSDEILITVK